MSRFRLLAVSSLVVVLAAGCAIDLGTLGGDFSQAADINDRGVVVGYAFTAANEQHAYRQAPGHRKVDLNGDFVRSDAVAVNRSGVTVGYAYEHDDGIERAVLWDRAGVAHDLGAGDESRATDINDDGVVVGNITTLAVAQLGWVWDPAVGEIEMLPHAYPGGEEFQQAEGINNDGTIVGTEDEPGSGAGSGAVFWVGPDHRPVGLAGLGATYSNAFDINDRGDIVGVINGDHSQRAIVWLAPAYEPLDITPPGAPYGTAFGINDRRQVVGLVSEINSEWTFRWDARNGQFVDLGGLGGSNARAVAINEQGVAVGWATTGDVTSTGYPISHATAFIPRPGHSP